MLSSHGIFPTNFYVKVKVEWHTSNLWGENLLLLKEKKRRKVSRYQIQSISVEFAINRMDQQHKAKVPVTARDPDN